MLLNGLFDWVVVQNGFVDSTLLPKGLADVVVPNGLTDGAVVVVKDADDGDDDSGKVENIVVVSGFVVGSAVTVVVRVGDSGWSCLG